MSGAAGFGQQAPSAGASEFNAYEFLIKQTLARTRTMQLVTVMAVTNMGEVAPVGFVDVKVMTNMLDGQGNSSSHETIHNIPYTRIQGGTNAVIIDPAVGDIGWMAVADRDISSVKANKAISNPGSFRRFDLADGVYLGGILNGTPVQYVRFMADGMELVDKNGNTRVMNADGITDTDCNGNIIEMNSSGVAITTSGTFTVNGVNVGDTHIHSDVTTGADDTGAPI